MKEDEWTLKQQFVFADIQRINHPQYFSTDFSCHDLDAFILQVYTKQDAIKNQVILNKFYDNLIDIKNQSKTIYVRLKWLTYLHKLIHNFQVGSVMFNLTVKALQIYSDKFVMVKITEYFQNYLTKKIFKPYIQYLAKLCMLNIPNKNQTQLQEKQNIQHNNNQQSEFQKINSPFSKPQKQKTERKYQIQNQQILEWYRNYNFLLQSLQVFPLIFQQQDKFFKSQLPFLGNIRKLISYDLKNILNSLKNSQVSLQKINMTVLQLNKLQQKITQFAYQDVNIFNGCQSLLMTNIQDYSKEDINNFMFTPLKPNRSQLKKVALNFS